MPLNQPLGVGQRSFFLRRRRSGNKKDFCSDLLRRRPGRIVLPEGCAFGLEPVGDHQPFQVPQALANDFRVDRPRCRILPEQEVAVKIALRHPLECQNHGIIVVEARQPVVAKVIGLRRRFPIIRFKQADHELFEMDPVAGRQALVLDILIERVMRRVGSRLGQIPRQQIVQRRDVRGPLNAGVAAQGHDPPAGSAHVAEQSLQNARRADDLHARRVHGPADRVADRTRALTPGIVAQRFRDLDNLLGRAAADVGGHLRRIPLEMPAQELHHAVRVLQSLVALSMPRL